MFKKNSLSSFLMTFLCVVSFFTCVFVNAQILDVYLLFESLSFTYFDEVAFFKMSGYIVASVVVVMFSSWLSFFRAILVAMPLYYFSCFNIIYLDTDNTATMFYFIIYAATFLIMALLLVEKIIEQKAPLILIILACLLAYILIINLDIFAIAKQGEGISVYYALIMNIIPVSIFGWCIFSLKNYRKIRNAEGYNFNIVIKNMEIEALVSFSMFYVVMSVRNGYEVFSLSHHLAGLSTKAL